MPNAELFTPFQKQVLKAFAGFEESKAFYLTGGTALSAFYLAHRHSEDFDLFTLEEPLIAILARKLKPALENLGIKVDEIRSFSSFWEDESRIAASGARGFGLDRASYPTSLQKDEGRCRSVV